MSGCVLNEVTLNEEDLSYIFDEATTPVRSCGDMAYQATQFSRLSSQPFSYFDVFAFTENPNLLENIYLIRKCISDNMSKEPKERRETSSQVKRRRMLQFDNQAVDNSLCCDELPYAFLKSNVSAGHSFLFLIILF